MDTPSPVQLRARRVSAVVRYPLIAAAVVGALGSAAFDVYPYRFFMDAEHAIFGVYHPAIGVLLALVTCLVPLVVVVHVTASFLPRTQEERAFIEADPELAAFEDALRR